MAFRPWKSAHGDHRATLAWTASAPAIDSAGMPKKATMAASGIVPHRLYNSLKPSDYQTGAPIARLGPTGGHAPRRAGIHDL
jgi:hypothetical protein